MVIDHVLRDVGEGYSEDGDVPCVARHMLVLVLFLQGLGRRKVMGEKRERKTQFVMGRLGFAGDIPHHTSPGHEGGGHCHCLLYQVWQEAGLETP